MKFLWLALVCLSGACADRDAATTSERALPRRVFQPAPERVHAVAPHNIHEAGMGPYKLGASLEEVLNLLPQFPPVELLKHPGWFDYSLVRAERGKLVVGVDPSTGVDFIAALDKEVARTESNMGVGVTLKALEKTLGPPMNTFQLARDPRVLTFAKMKQYRFLVQRGLVRAVIVGGGLGASPKVRPTCTGWDAIDATPARVVARMPNARVISFCAGKNVAAVALHRNRLALLEKEGPMWKRLASISMEGLAYAAPLDVDGDGSQEVATVSMSRDDERFAVRVRVLSWDGSKWGTLFDGTPYRLSAYGGGWTGPRLEDTQLLVEVAAGANELSVGGLYLELVGREVRSLVPLDPVSWPLPDRMSRTENDETNPGKGE